MSPVADDLRAKIAKTFACRCDPVWTERKLHAPDCVEELGEDVLDEVADWLRDEAAEQARLSKRTLPEWRYQQYIGVAAALEALADRLTQPSTEQKPT